MKRLLITHLIIIICATLLSACASNNFSLNSDLPESFDTTTSVVIIIDDPRSNRRKSAALSTGYQMNISYETDPVLSKKSNSIAADYALDISYEWPIKSLNVHCFVVKTQNPEQTISQLMADNRVRSAQTLNTFLAQSVPEENLKSQPKTKKSFKDLNKENSIQKFYREKMQFGTGQRIAIIDTSADLSHPDLKKSKINQWDFVGSKRGQRVERHGTAVVGLIAAQPENGIGIDGTAPKADVGVFRGCWQENKDSNQAKCDTVSLSLALDAALRWNPDIVNLSCLCLWRREF